MNKIFVYLILLSEFGTSMSLCNNSNAVYSTTPMKMKRVNGQLTLDLVNATDDRIYTGQKVSGDGQIDPNKISIYVSERYPNYKFIERYDIDDSLYEPKHQYDPSYYVKQYRNYNGSIDYTSWSEGNCALVSVFVMLNNWKANKIIHTTNSNYDVTDWAKRTEFYKNSCGIDHMQIETTEDGETNYYYWRLKDNSYLENMPYFYNNIRAYASDLGYTVTDGFSYSNVKLLVSNVLLNVGNLNFNVSKDGTSNTNTVANVQKGVASYMAMFGSSTYGNHAVAVVGYSKYKYTVGSKVYYKYFYEICDGWNKTSRYFDPNTDASPTLMFVSN